VFDSSPAAAQARQVHHLFFAALPCADIAARVVKLAATLRSAHKLRGAPTAAERLHITLCPVATFDGQPLSWIVAEAVNIAEQIASVTPPFGVVFNRAVGFDNRWRGAKLALCGGEELKPAVILQQNLRSALRRAGVDGGRGTLSNPHVTIVYDAGRVVGEYPIIPISWPIEQFVLIDSLHGQDRHVRLGSWPLRG